MSLSCETRGNISMNGMRILYCSIFLAIQLACQDPIKIEFPLFISGEKIGIIIEKTNLPFVYNSIDLEISGKTKNDLRFYIYPSLAKPSQNEGVRFKNDHFKILLKSHPGLPKHLYIHKELQYDHVDLIDSNGVESSWGEYRAKISLPSNLEVSKIEYFGDKRELILSTENSVANSDHERDPVLKIYCDPISFHDDSVNDVEYTRFMHFFVNNDIHARLYWRVAGSEGWNRGSSAPFNENIGKIIEVVIPSYDFKKLLPKIYCFKVDLTRINTDK